MDKTSIKRMVCDYTSNFLRSRMNDSYDYLDATDRKRFVLAVAELADELGRRAGELRGSTPYDPSLSKEALRALFDGRIVFDVEKSNVNILLSQLDDSVEALSELADIVVELEQNYSVNYSEDE